MSKKRIALMMSCTTISGALLIIGLFNVIEGKECPTMTRAHATRCDKYYECKIENGKTEWSSRQCEEGLVYDHDLAVCVLPDVDWECQLPDDDPLPLVNLDNNILGVENLDMESFQIINTNTPVYPNNEDDDNRDLYNQIETKIKLVKDDFERRLGYSRMPKINLSEKEEGSGAGDPDQVANVNSLITTQLLRLNQLMKGIRRDEESASEITPDKLNQFLAVQNIQAETTTLPTSEQKSVTQINELDSDEMNEILNLTETIGTTQVPPDSMLLPLALPTKVSKVPTTVESEIFTTINKGGSIYSNKVTPLKIDGTKSGESRYKTEAEKFQDLIASLKASTVQPHQQIIVHRPGGSVWFNVPTSTDRTTTQAPPTTPQPFPYPSQFIPPPQQYVQPQTTTQKTPGFSEEVLRLLLELSKQLATNNQQNQIQKPAPPQESVLQPIVRPIYINVPVQQPPVHNQQQSPPNYYDEKPQSPKSKPLVNSYGQKLPTYPPLQDSDYNEQDYSDGNPSPNRYNRPRPNTDDTDSSDYYVPQRQSGKKKPSYYPTPSRIDNNPYSYTKPVNYGHYYYEPPTYQNGQTYPNYQAPYYQDFSSTGNNLYKPYYVQQQQQQQQVQVPPSILYSQSAFHLPLDPSGISLPGANGIVTQFNNVGQSVTHDNIHSHLSEDNDAEIDSVDANEGGDGEEYEEDVDNGKKKYVDLGGNIFSYDQYMSSILPLLQDTDKIKEAQVVTCTNGARQANRTDCTKYFLCNPKTGGIYSFSCPLNTAFDESSKFCNRKRYTECKQQTKNSAPLKLHYEALKALEEAKRIKDELVQAQNYASFLQYQNMRPKKKSTTTTTKAPPLTRDSLPLLAALIQNYKGQQQQQQSIPIPMMPPVAVTKKPNRHITCLQPGKVPDPDSTNHYYVCFKTPENYLKLHKMKCPMNFNFCKSNLLCTPSEKCADNMMGR